MSGGSFDYLEYRLGALREYVRVRRTLIEQGADPLSSAVHDLDAFIAAYARMNELQTMLEPIIHAVEWCASGDWGNDQVIEAVQRYENER